MNTSQDDVEAALSRRLEAAAGLIEADRAPSDPEIERLLRHLGYDASDASNRQSRARILRLAGKLRRVFQLPVPDAPGLIFFGGIADPAMLGPAYTGLPPGNLAGSGVTPQRALESCVGEGAEYLSQFVRPGDPIVREPRRLTGDPHADTFIDRLFAACGIEPGQPLDWIATRRLSDQAEAWFPVDLCLRRVADQQDFVPPLKLSTGCAAGVTFEAAVQRAILELVERDAVALWWRGGRRALPIEHDSEAGRAGAELWHVLRQGRRERQSWLLDITTDLKIPAVAAISANHDGHGFAYGFGARMSLAEAARAAIFELAQVELSQHVIAAKRRESGDAALNDSDRKQLRRANLFDTRQCELLQPHGPPALAIPGLPVEPAAAIAFLVDRLASVGVSAYMLDLTRSDLEISVVRVLAPGLQLEPCQIVTDRLAAVIAETGGGATHTGGMALL